MIVLLKSDNVCRNYKIFIANVYSDKINKHK